jgi:hypothetical protein
VHRQFGQKTASIDFIRDVTGRMSFSDICSPLKTVVVDMMCTEEDDSERAASLRFAVLNQTSDDRCPILLRFFDEDSHSLGFDSQSKYPSESLSLDLFLCYTS